MNDEPTITILQEEIPVRYENIPIYDLKYFEGNPRVFSCIYREKKPDTKEDLQELIHVKMLEQPSVKNLKPRIEAHGGLQEEILVRYDTREVIEGNSRLAVFRVLYEQTQEERWANIPCKVVTKLNPDQQDAYLSEMHVVGKTPWSAYEKANLAYIRQEQGIDVVEIARRLGVGVGEVNKRIEVVSLMKKNCDEEISHFSYYDVLVRTRKINQSLNYTPEIKDMLLDKIKDVKTDNSGNTDFTAPDLRNKMPAVLSKKKELKKFAEGKSTLDDAYQNARPSDPLKKVKLATEKIRDITKLEVSHLEVREINVLLLSIKRLFTEVGRVREMTEKVKNDNA